MEDLSLSSAIELCKSEKNDKGKEMLIEKLQTESIGLILSKTKVSLEQDALSIFYDSIIDIVDEIISEKFIYIDDVKFKAYFKRKCIFKAKAFIRNNLNPFISFTEISEQTEDMLEIEYNEIRRSDYNKKNLLYNIELTPDNKTSGLPVQVMKAFHQLSDKCKILIILKKIMSISHKKIVDSIGTLYSIGNENVSKASLRRCWKMLVTQAS